MSTYNNNDDIMQKLQDVEDNVENLSNMIRHLHTKIEVHFSKMDKLDNHIDFIEQTYKDLKNPIEGIKRWVGK